MPTRTGFFFYHVWMGFSLRRLVSFSRAFALTARCVCSSMQTFQSDLPHPSGLPEGRRKRNK